MSTETKKIKEWTELDEIRRTRLIYLLNESGDKRKVLGEKSGISATQVSGFLSSSSTQKRAINNTQARSIEKAYGKPTFWMDTPQSQKPQSKESTNSNDDELEELIDAVLYGVDIARAEIIRQLKKRPLSRDEKKKLLLASIQCNIQGQITEEQFGAIVSSLL